MGRSNDFRNAPTRAEATARRCTDPSNTAGNTGHQQTAALSQTCLLNTARDAPREKDSEPALNEFTRRRLNRAFARAR